MMSSIQEYIGCKSIEAVDYDGKGNALCNMWLTDTEIVRCNDCRFAHMRGGQLVCNVHERFVATDPIGLPIQEAYFVCTPKGFCAWGERCDAR